VTASDFPENADLSPSAPRADFFVVGVGGSAGALEAFTELLRNLPPDPGLALVIVQHMAAEPVSLLVELLGRATTWPVAWAAHDEPIKPGRIYVAPRDG
jgi:two-component system CheB/CheR fusion protein